LEVVAITLKRGECIQDAGNERTMQTLMRRKTK